MKIVLAAASALILCGCMTKEPQIESTKQWENHYFTVEQFKNGTKDILLDKDETIWVLSNTTLNRLLQNTGK